MTDGYVINRRLHQSSAWKTKQSFYLLLCVNKGELKKSKVIC